MRRVGCCDLAADLAPSVGRSVLANVLEATVGKRREQPWLGCRRRCGSRGVRNCGGARRQRGCRARRWSCQRWARLNEGYVIKVGSCRCPGRRTEHEPYARRAGIRRRCDRPGSQVAKGRRSGVEQGLGVNGRKRLAATVGAGVPGDADEDRSDVSVGVAGEGAGLVEIAADDLDRLVGPFGSGRLGHQGEGPATGADRRGHTLSGAADLSPAERGAVFAVVLEAPVRQLWEYDHRAGSRSRRWLRRWWWRRRGSWHERRRRQWRSLLW